MSPKRLYIGQGIVLLLLLLALLGGTYGVSHLFASRADQLTALKAKSQALNQEQTSLDQAKQDIKKYSNLAGIAKNVVPEDKNQAEAVREIVKLAAANNIKLATITFPESTLGSSGAANGTTVRQSTSANAASSRLSQLTPVKNIPGVYVLPITIQGDPQTAVQYTSFINFLSALEHNRRTAQISTITLTPDPGDSSLLTFQLSLNEYIEP
ncbi:MAG TPA: hypothetical protein VG992_03330 [Candidatus Saccharimonadales bacterium]|nr:hypothetical protein [Candidatus Saccharimonadales bacterium]